MVVAVMDAARMKKAESCGVAGRMSVLVLGGGLEREGEVETHRGEECGYETSPPAENGGDSNQKLDDGGDESNDVGNEHPFAHGLVDPQSVCELFRERVLNSGIL